MPNIPSKWFDFVNHKELKRLHSDINNNMLFKIQTALSAILTILSVLLSAILQENRCAVIWICSSLIVVIVLLFLVPFLIKAISNRIIKNIFIKGQDAVSIFDEEIVYYVMTACEYSQQDSRLYNSLQKDVDSFFCIEIEYYVNKAMEKLVGFVSNFDNIFGNGKNRISKPRLGNVTSLLDTLIANYKIDNKHDTQYIALKSKLNSLSA